MRLRPTTKPTNWRLIYLPFARGQQIRMIESPEEFVRLRTSDDPDECRRAAHESAPLEVWLTIIEKYPEMRYWVAHNKTIPPDVYFALYDVCKDSSSGTDAWRTKVMLAMKRSCPADLLQQFASDADESVRDSVASNKKTPVHILEKLSNDEWEVCARSARSNLAAKNLEQMDE